MKKLITLSSLLLVVFLISLHVGRQGHFSSFIPNAFAEQSNLAVSARIRATASDFQFNFTSDTNGIVDQNRTITYTITYGASESAGFDVETTLVADYSNATAPNGTQIIDYVIGSATEAYGGTQPVIDPTKRTISWNIPELPAGSVDQTVSFQLRTNENYTASTRSIGIYIAARFINEFVTFPDQLVIHTFKYNPNQFPPGPTATPIPPPPPTPTPAPIPPLKIIDVDINTITDSTANIGITTSAPTRISLAYGTSPDKLTKIATSNSLRTTTQISLTALTPQTPYYFRITATDATGQTTSSDLFTFTTARESLPPDLTNSAVVITSGSTVILSDIVNGFRVPFAILPTQTGYQLTYTLDREMGLVSLETIISGKTYLMTQTGPRTYTANLQTEDAGIYPIIIRANDSNGNIIQQNAVKLKVTPKLRVIEKGTGAPIGDARVILWKYNKATNKYVAMTDVLNPVYTNTTGEAFMLLGPGKYRAEASALWYTSQAVEFTLGEEPDANYPTIYLEYNPFNILAFIKFVIDWFIDTFNKIIATLQNLTSSIRIFNTVAIVAVGASVLLTAITFTLRTDIRWKALIPFLMFILYFTARKHKDAYLYGFITTPDKKPITLARVEVIDLKSNIVLTHTMTNKAGHFAIRNTFKQQYIKLLVTKDGFEELESIITTNSHEPIMMILAQHSKVETRVTKTLGHVLGELFELTLLLTLIAELFLLFSFGVVRTLPFFITSLMNLIMWLFFVRQRRM